MKHLILGTAGHIDHGKTRLVKALTGIDTDTLEEEKRRGISINLGYAFYDLPGGTRIGIIDVPGHMKFIKTMLSGVAGIDFVLFIVAADDSVMPQTKEHFDILRLLNIKRGIIVITKTDLVDSDTALLVEEEVKDLVKGSFLEGAPVVKVSAQTGDGIEALKSKIEEVALSMEERRDHTLFRLPVDRCFSVTGFGTVVTGTVFSGKAIKGEPVSILPSGLKSEIRGIEVHGNKKDEAYTGQRAALNLTGLAKDDVKRGNVICTPGYFVPTSMLDCSLDLLNPLQPLKQGERVKFHLCTSEIEGRIYFLKEKNLVQIRLHEEVIAVKGDRFIIRNQEASRTLGGGVVLDAHPNKHRRIKGLDTKSLQTLATQGISGQVLLELGKARSILPVTVICGRLTEKKKSVENALKKLSEEGKALIFISPGDVYGMAIEKYSGLLNRINTAILEFHSSHPLLSTGLSKAEVSQICANIFGEKESSAIFILLWDMLGKSEMFKDIDNTLVTRTWQVQNTEEDDKLSNKVFLLFDNARFSPPDKNDALRKTGSKRAFPVFEALVKSGRLVKIDDYYFSKDVLAIGEAKLKEYLLDKKAATVSDLKQVIDTSRKYAIPLLNYYEAKGLLLRQGDLRILA